jgi:hypothetical protein
LRELLLKNWKTKANLLTALEARPVFSERLGLGHSGNVQVPRAIHGTL